MSELTLAVIGVDHRHIYGQLAGMLAAGGRCAGWWTQGDPHPVEGFFKRFPDVPRVDDRRQLLDDPDVDLVLIADIPARPRRPGDRSHARRQGCHDRQAGLHHPGTARGASQNGCRDRSHLVRRFLRTVRNPGVDQGGGAGARRRHRPGRADRRPRPAPPQPRDAAPTGSSTPRNMAASCAISPRIRSTSSCSIPDPTMRRSSRPASGNFANPDDPGLEDFGEILIRSDRGQGYIRVDWYTPDALPTWGDGRLTILGTEGTIELRKYVDIAGRPGTDHLFLVKRNGLRAHRRLEREAHLFRQPGGRCSRPHRNRHEPKPIASRSRNWRSGRRARRPGWAILRADAC